MTTLKRAIFALFIIFISLSNVARADHWEIGNYPTKISIVVDTSNSMLGVDGSTLTQKSILVRNELAKNTSTMVNLTAIDLWHFGGRANKQCAPALVYEAAQNDADIVNAVASLKERQAGNMLAMDDARNPIAASLTAAAAAGSQGIVLITDSAEDCNYAPKAVCEIAGTIDIPVYVLSLSTTRQGRAELECLANVSHGAFAHVTAGQEIAPLMKTLLTVAVSRAQMSVAEEIILELVRKNTELRDDNKTLAEDNVALERENAALKEQIAGLEAVIVEVRRQLDLANQTIADQKVTIGELHSAVEALTAENADLKATVAALTQEVADQKIIIGELKTMVEHLEGEIIQKDAAIAALHAELNLLSEENSALREENARLQADLQAANEEIVVLEEHIYRLIGERAGLELQLSERVQDVADLRVELESCQQAKQALSDTVDEQLITINELEQTVITATANCEGRVQSIIASEQQQCAAKISLIETGCAKEKAALDAHIAKLNTLIEQKDSAIGGLHKEIEGLMAEIDAKNEEIKSLSEQIVGQSAKIDGLIYENGELHKTIKGLQHSIKDLSLALQNCEDNLGECKIENGSLINQLQAKVAEVKALERALDESQSLLRICEGKLGEAIVEKNRVQYFIELSDNLRAELEMTKDKLSACEADKAAFKSGLNPLVDDHLEVPSEPQE